MSSKAVLVLEKMPKDCGGCKLWSEVASLKDFSDGYRGRCVITGGLKKTATTRPLWCPLRELPDKQETHDGISYDEGFAEGWNGFRAWIGGDDDEQDSELHDDNGGPHITL